LWVIPTAFTNVLLVKPAALCVLAAVDVLLLLLLPQAVKLTTAIAANAAVRAIRVLGFMIRSLCPNGFLTACLGKRAAI
jgi:hypothetical protein